MNHESSKFWFYIYVSLKLHPWLSWSSRILHIAHPHLLVRATSKWFLSARAAFRVWFSQWEPLDVTNVDKNRSLKTHTSKCGWTSSQEYVGVALGARLTICRGYHNHSLLIKLPMYHQQSQSIKTMVTNKTHQELNLTICSIVYKGNCRYGYDSEQLQWKRFISASNENGFNAKRSLVGLVL